MLINVFGRWLNSERILYLSAEERGTYIHLTDGYGIVIQDKTIDEVAKKIIEITGGDL